jgi:hypothetical protein
MNQKNAYMKIKFVLNIYFKNSNYYYKISHKSLTSSSELNKKSLEASLKKKKRNKLLVIGLPKIIYILYDTSRGTSRNQKKHFRTTDHINSNY